MEYTFSLITQEEIDECVSFIISGYSISEPLTVKLKMDFEESRALVAAQVKLFAEKGIMTICKSKEGKIIGTYGAADINLFELNMKTESPDEISVLATNEEKRRFRNKNEVDMFKVMLARVKLLKKNAVFCKYYLVDKNYMGTSLSKELAFNHFANVIQAGYRLVYGVFYNEKAINIMLKSFKGQIAARKKVRVNGEEFEVLLLEGDTKEIKLTAKF